MWQFDLNFLDINAEIYEASSVSWSDADAKTFTGVDEKLFKFNFQDLKSSTTGN